MTIPLASGIFMIFCLISVIVVSWKTVKGNMINNYHQCASQFACKCQKSSKQDFYCLITNNYHTGREFIGFLINTDNSTISQMLEFLSFQTHISLHTNNGGSSLSGCHRTFQQQIIKQKKFTAVIISTVCFSSKSMKEEISFVNVVAIPRVDSSSCRSVKSP